MEKRGTSRPELPLAEQVYEQMNGFYVRPLVPGVRDESRDGVLTPYLDALYDARGRLCRRCGLAEEDADLEALLNAAEGLCRACALEMFRYGRQLAKKKKK